LEHDLFRKPVSTFRDHALESNNAAKFQQAGALRGLPGRLTPKTVLHVVPAMTTQKIVLAAPFGVRAMPPRRKQRRVSFKFAPGNQREAKRRKAQPSIGRAASASVAAH
jgi:hypothetical protein